VTGGRSLPASRGIAMGGTESAPGPCRTTPDRCIRRAPEEPTRWWSTHLLRLGSIGSPLAGTPSPRLQLPCGSPLSGPPAGSPCGVRLASSEFDELGLGDSVRCAERARQPRMAKSSRFPRHLREIHKDADVVHRPSHRIRWGCPQLSGTRGNGWWGSEGHRQIDTCASGR
jgi:hypothetical protein